MTPSTPDAPRPIPVLAGLCVIELCSWGVLSYTLPVIGTSPAALALRACERRAGPVTTTAQVAP